MQLGLVLREAFKGLGRNLTMTVAMVITTAISVALVVAGVLVTNMTNDTKEIYLERVEVMVQLNEDISANDPECSSPECADLKKQLESEDDVESVTYRDRQASYDRFVELFKETDPVMVEETSPDALPAAFHVRLVDPTDTAPIDAIKDNPAVGEIIDQQEGRKAEAPVGHPVRALLRDDNGGQRACRLIFKRRIVIVETNISIVTRAEIMIETGGKRRLIGVERELPAGIRE